MKKIQHYFLQGLIAILPLTFTLFIITWLASAAETTLGAGIKWLLPESWYWPGMGILLGFLFVAAIGFLLKAYIFQRLAHYVDELFTRIPWIKTIYNSINDIARFVSISKEGSNELQQAVLVSIKDGHQAVGFVTKETVSLGRVGDDRKGLSAVYIPMSYQLGGFTLLIEKDKIEPLNMTVQEAMGFVLTAGISKNKKER